ncbi:unnamed protein product [Chrysoparadoxa australica]
MRFEMRFALLFLLLWCSEGFVQHAQPSLSRRKQCLLRQSPILTQEEVEEEGVRVLLSSTFLEEPSMRQLMPSEGSSGSSSPPQRFQKLVRRLWEGFNQEDQMDYLGEEGRFTIKKALVVLAAYSALLEHPLGEGRATRMSEIFQQADYDSNGEVSFDEFNRWFSESSEEARARLQKQQYRKRLEGMTLPGPSEAWPVILTADAVAGMGGRAPASDDAEKEKARQLWLSGGEEQEAFSPAAELRRSIPVVQTLLQTKADPETIVSALAHDFFDPTSEADAVTVKEHFGPVVLGIMRDQALLDHFPLLAPPSSTAQGTVRPLLDLGDKEAKLLRDYMIHGVKDVRAVVIHMARLTSSLRELNANDTKGEGHYMALKALQLYVPVSNALGLGSGFKELEELSYSILFPETYSELKLWHADLWASGKAILVHAKATLRRGLEAHEELQGYVESYSIPTRTKGALSTFRKVFRQAKKKEAIHDLLGLRIVVQLRDDCPRGPVTTEHSNDSLYTFKTYPPPYRDYDSVVLHLVHQVVVGLWTEEPGRYKNYVDFPKSNGYRSIHTVVSVGGGFDMEVQIRTLQQHKEAEQGLAAHSLYKGGVSNAEDVSQLKQWGVAPVSTALLPPSKEASE